MVFNSYLSLWDRFYQHIQYIEMDSLYCCEINMTADEYMNYVT